MTRQRAPQRHGRALIKENTQLRECDRTTRRMGQDGADLRQRHPGEPLHEVMDWHIVFQIFEEGYDGYTRSAKQPRTAVPFRVLRDRFAGGPVNHRRKITRKVGEGRLTSV